MNVHVLDTVTPDPELLAWVTERAAAVIPVWDGGKDGAPCCELRRLPDGRPVIGFCSEACLRRPRGGGS